MSQLQIKEKNDAALREYAQRFMQPARAGTQMLQDSLPEDMRLPAMPAQAGGFDLRGFLAGLPSLPGIDPFQALKLQKEFAPKDEEFNAEPRYDQQGNAYIVSKAGNIRRLDGVKARDKLIETNLGGQVGFRTEYSPQMQNLLAKTASPDSMLSATTAMRGQNMTDARARERLSMDSGNAIADAGGLNQSLLIKRFGKAPAGFRWKEDGSMESIPGGPSDRKSQEQMSGKETVDKVAADLFSSYDSLNKGGGIGSTEAGTLSNVGAFASSSGAGQMAGRMLGTKNQKERDSIAQARPLLLQAIMKATGMSAKQMDSNAELKLYLATATDPTLSLEANKEALGRILQLYGSGAQTPGINPGAKPRLRFDAQGNIIP
jgi:hypothetical protein